MPTTTSPNLPTRQNHNLYSVPDPLGAGLTEADQAGFLDIEKARDEAYRLDSVSTLVAGYDNYQMDSGSTEDWTQPSTGIEGGPELFKCAQEMNADGYSPSKIKQGATDKLISYMDASLNAKYQEQTIDGAALLAAHPGKTFAQAAQAELPTVIATLETEIRSLNHKKTAGTIRDTELKDLARAEGSRVTLAGLNSAAAKGHVIGTRKKLAANFDMKATQYDSQPTNNGRKADYEKMAKSVNHESTVLRREAALFHGIAKLDGGKYADKSFIDKSKVHIANLHTAKVKPTNPTTAASNAKPLSNPETERLRALAYADQKAAVHGRYERAVQSLAEVSGKRSSFTGNNEANSTTAAQAHEEFSDSVYQMMQYDDQYKGVLTNPDISVEERGALINAFYASKFNDLREKTNPLRGDNYVDKSANFINKHRTKLKIGAFVLGGLTGGVGGVILGAAISTGLSKAAKNQIKKGEAQAAADTGAAGTTSHINTYASLTAVNEHIDSMPRPHAIGPREMREIANAAYRNLMGQHETAVETYQDIHRKRSVGSAATGLAWGGAIFVGGHLGTQFLDYQAHGSGGFMDKLNHLDDPNGATPWRATVDKPWWMNDATPWLMTGAAAAGFAAAAHKSSKNKKKAPRKQSDYDLAR